MNMGNESTLHTHNTHKPYTNLTNDCDINKKKNVYDRKWSFPFPWIVYNFLYFFFYFTSCSNSIAWRGDATVTTTNDHCLCEQKHAP